MNSAAGESKFKRAVKCFTFFLSCLYRPMTRGEKGKWGEMGERGRAHATA